MLATRARPPRRAIRLLFAACLPVLVTACESEGNSLISLSDIDLADSLSEDVLTALNSDPNNSGLASPDGETIAPPLVGETSNVEVPSNGITPELELLTRGQLRFESSFNGTTEPIPDAFQLSSADYSYFPEDDIATLSAITDSAVTICTHLAVTGQYICLRGFDLLLSERAWHVFTMQSATSGAGIFEFCDETVTEEDCSEKLVNDPDGTDTVSILPSNASASLPGALPYFAYGEQGTLNRQSNSQTTGAHYLNTMNALVVAARQSATK